MAYAHPPNTLKKYPFFLYFLLLFVVAGLLLGRLFYMQVIQRDHYLKKAVQNRQSVVPILAPRGMIYDHKSRILATNKESYSLLFSPRSLTLEQIYYTLAQLSDYLDLSYEELIEKVSFETLAPVYLKRRLDDETVALILENKAKFKGVEIKTTVERYYPENAMAAHSLGYLGQITKAELKSPQFKGYYPGVMIGKNGVERILEKELKGIDGQQIYEIDPQSKEKQFLKTTSAVPGKAVQLTLDKGLQLHSEQLLKAKNYRGAIVVLDVETGAIRALASQPAFNPNLFIQGFSKEQWNELQKADAHPFLNRALNPYAPGSIFKMVTALAALEKGFLTRERQFMSRGFLNVHGHIFYDWNRAGFGQVDLVKALAYSIDTVFYELALEMKIDAIEEYAKLFRIHQKTGVELPHERPGLIPNPEWKKKHFNQIWLPGDAVNASIGQGFIQMTPLQAARMTAMIATEGKMIYPYLHTPRLGPFTTEEKAMSEALQSIQPKHWAVVKEGMLGAVQYGTTRAMGVPGFLVAGKTGTAETGPGRPNHAWVVGYAPADRPRYAICVFLEHGVSGGGKAAPVGREVMKYLLTQMDHAP